MEIMKNNQLRVVVDANEANISNRVGSNVYAFEIITALEKLTRDNSSIEFTILLRKPPVSDLPSNRKNWKYRIIKPGFLWTQFGEPAHLFLNKNKYDILYTPGHYAPRCSSIPYISSVMDLAFLEYPKQYQSSDLIQLKHWTKYSVKNARKVIAISQYTKNDIVKFYSKLEENVLIASPAVSQISVATSSKTKEFYKRHKIRKPYFLSIGTLQPRKNLILLVEAYERLCRRLSSQQLSKKQKQLPQLVLAGKIGWLADPIIERVKASPFFEYIIMTNFVDDEIKPALYQNAIASLSIGLYEGFGIPALESLKYNCLPIVSNITSLPEVVGEAGLKVNPQSINEITQAMEKSLLLTSKAKSAYRRKAKLQLKKFSWEKSAQIILDTIKTVADERK